MDKQELPPMAVARLAWLERRKNALNGQRAEIERMRQVIDEEIRENRDAHARISRSATTPNLAHEMEELDHAHEVLKKDYAVNRAEYAEHGVRSGEFISFFSRCIDAIRASNYLMLRETNPRPGQSRKLDDRESKSFGI